MNARARTPTDAWLHLPPTELLAAVQLLPTPHIPLGSIRDLLKPLYDERGELIDWLLFATGLERRDAVAEYWRWRDTWRRHWAVGPVSNVAAFRDHVAEIDHDLDRRLDHLLDAIVAADGRPVQVAASDADELLAELATVRLALSVDDRTGWGIVDDMPARSRASGLARTWVLPPAGSPDVVLASTTESAVVLRAGRGLTVIHDVSGRPDPRDPHDEHEHGDHDARRGELAAFEDVRAADLRGELVVLLDERGQSLRLDQREARPLGWLVPRSLRWYVRQVPLVVVWAMLLDGLDGALRIAGASGEPMVITGESGMA